MEQEQLVAIRQQVMQQLKKQQAQAIQQGKAPPTKMTIHLARDDGPKTKEEERNGQEYSAAPDQQNPDQPAPKEQ